MNRLIEQMIKFGFVGVLCFLIDFCLYKGCNAAGIPYLLSGLIGFTVSVVVNYILSMKYVFERREDLSRKKEFTAFVILSIGGLILNEVLLYVGVDGIYMHSAALRSLMKQNIAETVVKLGATAVVMIYNFVTRKLILEKRG